MGTATMLRRRDGEAEPVARRALGPPEHAARGSALDRVLHLAERPGLAPAERRAIVGEVLRDELRSTVTFGGSELPELIEAAERGDREQVVLRLVGVGLSFHDAVELSEKVLTILCRTARHAVAGNVAMLAIEATMAHAKLGLAAIAQPHHDGDRNAAIASYAQTWAALVTEALYAGAIARPEHTGLAHLDEARHRAYADALAALRTLDAGGARTLAEQLRQELGTQSNARHALTSVLLAEAGLGRIVLHEQRVK